MSARLKELHEQVKDLDAKSKAITDKASSEKRNLTAEESAEWDRMDAEITATLSTIDREVKTAKRQAMLDESRGRLADDPEPRRTRDSDPGERAGGDDLVIKCGKHTVDLREGEDDDYKARAAKAELRGRATKDYRRKFRGGLMQSDHAKGGYLAPPQFVARLIQAVDDLTFMRGLATVLPPVMGAQSIGVPSLDTDLDDGTWTPEVPASAITEDTAMRFGKRQMQPHMVAKRLKISQVLLDAAVLDVESIVMQRLAYKFGLTEEKAFLTGNGVEKPLGVFTASNDGIPTTRDVTMSATISFNADDLHSTLSSLKGQYQSRASWIFHRDAIARIRKLKTGDGQYLWSPGLSAAEGPTILGRPFYMSEHAPSTFTTGLYVGILGDFSWYWILDSMNLSVQRLAELYAETNQVGFIGRKMTDGAPVLSEAFARMKLA